MRQLVFRFQFPHRCAVVVLFRHATSLGVRHDLLLDDDIVLSEQPSKRRDGDAMLLGERPSALALVVATHDVRDLLGPESLRESLGAIRNRLVHTIVPAAGNRKFPQDIRGQAADRIA